MIWSGLTKYLCEMIYQRGKAVEIPGFGVFGPLLEEWATLKNPLEKGDITNNSLLLT